MRLTKFDGIRLYQADEFYSSASYVKDITLLEVEYFLKRRKFMQLMNSYQERTGLAGLILLEAHGNKQNGCWIIRDGKRILKLQDWVDRKDGESLALLLFCCNPHDQEVHSEQSIGLHPRSNLSRKDLFDGYGMRLFVPGIGYVEESYYKMNKIINSA